MCNGASSQAEADRKQTSNNEVNMSIPEMNCRILEILADNALNTVSPHVMDSDVISNILDISPATTKELLKALHASGLIITNMDSQYSLITREGVLWLKGCRQTTTKMDDFTRLQMQIASGHRRRILSESPSRQTVE